MNDVQPLPGRSHASGARTLRIALWCLYEGIVKDGYLFKHRDAGLGADLLKAWCDLYDYGRTQGFEFLTFDQVQDWDSVDAILLCDRPLPGNPLVEAAMQSRAAKYLITSECPIIYQPSWDPQYHRQFRRVWTWDDSLVDGSFYLKSNSVTDPVLACDFEQQKARFHERKLVTLIAGAKSSQHPNELYSHRVRAIRWFESEAPEHFDLYGMGWNQEQFPSYRGAVEDKLATLANYRFCICYENAQGLSGYITEKLLDCLRVGTIPVYGGAPNVTRWIPQDCFISINQFSDYFALFDFLRNMDAQTYAGYLDRIAQFITGPGYRPFSIACMIEGLTRTLDWDLRQPRLPGAMLEQNPVSLAMEVRPVDVPLIVWFSYDPQDPAQQKLRGLWQFFASHFPAVQFYFVRHTAGLGPGEIRDNGCDLLVGQGTDLERAVHDMLLRRHPDHFLLFRASLEDVFDPEALRAHCMSLPADAWLQSAGCSLMGRGALEALRHAHPSLSRPQPQAWSAGGWLDLARSTDPLLAMEHMARIVRKLAA